MTSRPREKLLSSTTVYQGRIINLRVDRVELPNGRITTREIVEHPGAVVIVPLDGAGRVGMVRQYRSAIAQESLELPAGTREPPEPAAACAARELGEEMGLSAAHWFPLVEFYSSPGFCTELLSVFVAMSLMAVPASPEDDENISREWVELTKVPELIASGELRDGKSIASLLAFIQRSLAGGAPWQS